MNNDKKKHQQIFIQEINKSIDFILQYQPMIGEQELNDREKLECLAHSLLCLIDGCVDGYPYKIYPTKTPKIDIGGDLHVAFYMKYLHI